MRNISRKGLLWLLIVVASITAGSMIYIKGQWVVDERSPTVAFVQHHMTNPNGTLASYLQDATSEEPDIVAGREALSESLGLWMQYAIAKNDEALFKQNYDLLTTYYLMPQKYIAWKLDAEGESSVTTNALGDDLRIIGALLSAAELWEQDKASVLETAAELTKTLNQSVQMEGYYVDFHDFSNGISSDTLSLAYVDLPALKAMEQHELLEPGTYEKYGDMLKSMPDDGVFYPKSFNVTSKTYIYDDKVNLIDQLIVANHLATTSHKPDKLISFLKKEFKTRKQLAGQYKRSDHTPVVAYESPSVYGLAILLAIKSGDPKWAKQLYNHMITFRSQDPNYPGGYVFNGNTHAFDNLFPLIAETELQKYLRK
ncbi:glycosyl hydrolase family 8 [Paenibacillus xylanexedens]|uniref:glycosyl hydrolase family 8 n=1 Tax=Paenibacillus xylanexedens TaxID=528191 RepID=UPI0011A444EF|nr:glycosyl hydrolase family 8 [Paenibacillus xylanexedens]